MKSFPNKYSTFYYAFFIAITIFSLLIYCINFPLSEGGMLDNFIIFLLALNLLSMIYRLIYLIKKRKRIKK